MSKKIEYDEAVIEKFAHQLYARATSAVVGYTLLGVLVSLVGATFLPEGIEGILRLAVLFIAPLAGFAIGQSKAFLLKMQAQTALCQVQVEKNTRPVPIPPRAQTS